MDIRKKLLSAVKKVQKTFNEEAGTKEQNKETFETDAEFANKNEVSASVAEDLEQQSEIGDIKIATEVICVVASMAAQEVPGVLEMSGGLVDDVAKLMGKEKSAKGVRVELKENSKIVLPNFTTLIDLKDEKKDGKYVYDFEKLTTELAKFKDEISFVEVFCNEQMCNLENLPEKTVKSEL